MTFKVQYQSRKVGSIGGSWIWTEHKVVIRLSSVKKRGICLNVVLMLSRYLQSLKNTYPVAEEKKWLVISIITKNSGRTKGKIWPVMSVDRPLFWPLLWYNCFPVKFAKIFNSSFVQNIWPGVLCILCFTSQKPNTIRSFGFGGCSFEVLDRREVRGGSGPMPWKIMP